MNRTEAIQSFLSDHSEHPLAKQYSHDMEIQVNVGRCGGDPIVGSYAGRRWQGFSDGINTWKSFRIPWNAAHAPKYEDREMNFSLDKYVEAIGMTGWDWKNKISMWVGFDFDSIVEHKAGLTGDELSYIKECLQEIPWITLIFSTGGIGLHVYIRCNISSINTHTEHAAVAKALLDRTSALSGINLNSSVDTLGGNIWIWHKKSANNAYNIIKWGEVYTDHLPNWKNYVDIVSRTKIINKPETNQESLATAQKKQILDVEHLKLTNWFKNSGSLWWWVADKNMLVCHTYDLKRAYLTGEYRGYYSTISTGREDGHDQNCFCFPIRNGSWIVRRHTKSVTEHSSWFTDGSGWTTTYFNRLPTIRTAALLCNATEGEREFNYKNLAEAKRTLLMLNIELETDNTLDQREASIRNTDNGQVILEIPRYEGEALIGWVKKKDKWQRVFYQDESKKEIELPDESIRYLTATGIDIGWFLRSNNREWCTTKFHLLKPVLISLGNSKKLLDEIIGQCTLNSWELINEPFKKEYPGDRKWNKGSAQFRFNAVRGKHPSWDLILDHIGATLYDATIEDKWCQDNGIVNGHLFLLSWVSSLFQFPKIPLPYLFLYGPQNSGKSIFHESLALLFTQGYTRADHALGNQSGFNGELASSILCVVEETNLSKRSEASNRIKDWVTGLTLSIRAMYRQPYEIPNTTHWIQCANDPSYCPVFAGDTRIIVIRVNPLDNEIPKPMLLEKLEQEADAFIYTITHFDLPDSTGRLRVPVITTEEKRAEQVANKSSLQEFIEEKIYQIDGTCILYGDFYDAFMKWLGTSGERISWSKKVVSRALPFIRGKMGSEGYLHIGNISLQAPSGTKEPKTKYKLSKGRLVQ